MANHLSSVVLREGLAFGMAYESCAGCWSRLADEQFLEMLAIPPGGPRLDAGRSAGNLAEIILEVAALFIPSLAPGFHTHRLLEVI